MLLPIAVLVLAEIILRIFHAGVDVSVFVPSSRNQDYLALNPEVSKRYFTQEENATKGYYEEFAKIKNDKTYRIFIQGESSAVGFPYIFNGSFHRMLKYRLAREFPDINFEIINLGLTAVSSYTLADFAQAIINQKPDAVLIYAGHNEYVGALGVGSSSRLGDNRLFIKLGIRIRSLHLTQMILRITRKISNKSDGRYSETLMQRMALKQGIPLYSEKYYEGIEQFNKNLTQLLSAYRKNHIPVFISDLVSNEKDLKPFMSIACCNKKQKKFDSLLIAGETMLNEGNLEGAAGTAKKIINEDSLYAGALYLLGNTYLHKGDYKEAKKILTKAVDCDQLRFRAPSAINKCIRDLALKFNACLVPFYDSASAQCIGNIIGSELITEHVHPNLKGYSLLAELFHRALLKSNILAEYRYEPFPLDQFYAEMPLIRMDTLIGLINISRLKKGWPFYQEQEALISNPDNDLQYQLALEVVTGQMNWMQAMDTLYRKAIRENNHSFALRIAESLSLQFPYDPRFSDKAGRHAVALGNFEKAAFYFTKTFELTPTPELAQSAMIAYLRCDLPDRALPYCSYLMKKSPEGAMFITMRSLIENIIDLKMGFEDGLKCNEIAIEIASRYVLMGNFDVARKYLQMIPKPDPLYPEAQKILAEISKM